MTNPHAFAMHQLSFSFCECLCTTIGAMSPC